MDFETIKIEHTDGGYRVLIDDEPYYCENTAELAEFLEGLGV